MNRVLYSYNVVILSSKFCSQCSAIMMTPNKKNHNIVVWYGLGNLTNKYTTYFKIPKERKFIVYLDMEKLDHKSQILHSWQISAVVYSPQQSEQKEKRGGKIKLHNVSQLLLKYFVPSISRCFTLKLVAENPSNSNLQILQLSLWPQEVQPYSLGWWSFKQCS